MFLTTISGFVSDWLKKQCKAKSNHSKPRSSNFCKMYCIDDATDYALMSQIRHTHVQDGEAGGITQQIGATMVPVDAIREQTKMIKDVSFECVLYGSSLCTDTLKLGIIEIVEKVIFLP